MVSHGHRETTDPLYRASGVNYYNRTNFEGSSVPVKPDLYSEGIIDHERRMLERGHLQTLRKLERVTILLTFPVRTWRK
jgi:hypothetical protein